MAQVTAFFGGDSQVGTTLLSIAVSQALGERGRRVLLLLASSETDEEYFPPARAGMGTLLRISRIIKDDVNGCISRGASFDYMAGPDDMLKKQFYDPELIVKITDLAGKDYDFIIIDAGHDATLPLPISALTAASRRFYVVTGGVKCTVRFSKAMQTVINALGLDTSRDMLVLNKAQGGSSSYSLSDLTSVFGLEGLSVPAYDSPLLYEFSKSSAYGKDNGYTKAVNQLTDEIEAGARR